MADVLGAAQVSKPADGDGAAAGAGGGGGGGGGGGLHAASATAIADHEQQQAALHRATARNDWRICWAVLSES